MSGLKNFSKFTGNDYCQSLFFNKVAGLRPATLLKKSLWRFFNRQIWKIIKKTFFTEHLRTAASLLYNIVNNEISNENTTVRGLYRTKSKSKMELFVKIING